MSLRSCLKKPRSGLPNRCGKYDTIYQDPRCNISGSNATITEECNRYRLNPMIMDYIVKDAPAVITLGVNSDNRQYNDSHQYTDMDENGIVEAGNETELLYTRVTLLIKVPESNNACNATGNLLQYFLVQIKQIYWNVA